MASSITEAPPCLLCGTATRILYPSNVPEGAPIETREVACTSPFLGTHDDIFVCRDCGLARSVPPPAVEIEDLYRNVEDPEYFVSELERRVSFRRSLERIEAHGLARPPGRLLEIGASVGLFLEEARRAGWDVTGIEPSRWAAESARARGLDVFNGTLEEFQAPEGGFDLVTSWDVWEHLEDPLSALGRVHDVLKPGGAFVLTTINLGGLGRKLFRGRWPWFMRMHLHYFTRESLTRMVRGAGFDVVSTSTEPKTLQLGYVLERSRSFIGPAARVAQRVASTLGLAERPIRVDLGDILLVEARRPKAP
jgi:2-polyprenyl-3-methyl-5-hydroxy-6-metoxy-1,4-benzoquinol methylase